MAIEFVSAGAQASGTGSVTVGLPSGTQLGDLMLMFVETANQTVTIPGIWLDVPDSPQGVGTAAGTAATRLKVMYRWDDGTTPDTGLADPGNHVIARIVAYRGVDPDNPFNASAGSTKATASTTATFPNITTTVANCWVLMAEAHALPDSNSTSIAGTRSGNNLTSVAERLDNNTNAGNGGGFSMADGLKATAGSVTGGTVTLTTSTVGAHITLALAPQVLTERTGTFSATETGADAFSGSGGVASTGSMAVSETGSDTFSASGAVTDPTRTGSLAATESGADTLASSGTVLVEGALAVSESGSDTFTATGDVFVSGALSVTESGADTFAASGTVANQEATGTLAASETGQDTFTSTGDVIVHGSLAVSETGQDSFASVGDVLVQGSLAVTEANDTFLGGGASVATGSLDATEGGDTFTGSGIASIPPVTGSLSASEQPDVAGGYVADGYVADGYILQGWSGSVLVSGSMVVTESGEDAFSAASSEPEVPTRVHEVTLGGAVYVRRGVKVLKFKSLEEAQAFLEAEEAANDEPPSPSKARKARQKAAKRAYTVAQPETIRLDAIQQAIEKFQIPVELPKLENKQDWVEFVRIALLVQQMEDDEEDAIEMLLLA